MAFTYSSMRAAACGRLCLPSHSLGLHDIPVALRGLRAARHTTIMRRATDAVDSVTEEDTAHFERIAAALVARMEGMSGDAADLEEQQGATQPDGGACRC
jgi:hypothetical protein